jgi:hypothetical protein
MGQTSAEQTSAEQAVDDFMRWKAPISVEIMDLPEDVLGLYLASKKLPSASRETLLAHSHLLQRKLMSASATVYIVPQLLESTRPFSDGTTAPTILLARASEGPIFFQLMYDADEGLPCGYEGYGPAVEMYVPGTHVSVCGRCMGNLEPTFTRAVEDMISPPPHSEG